jgi:hypothetical protein
MAEQPLPFISRQPFGLNSGIAIPAIYRRGAFRSTLAVDCFGSCDTGRALNLGKDMAAKVFQYELSEATLQILRDVAKAIFAAFLQQP